MLKRSLLLFLYSTPNIVGCLLGVFGLLSFFAGIIKAYWLFIVLGLGQNCILNQLKQT